MTSFQSMVAILLRLKVRNGKNIEKSVHLPSLTCVSILNLFVNPLMKPFLNSYQRNNKLVWDASVQIMNGLFTEVWAGKDTISVDHAVEITLPVWVFFRLPNLSPHTEILSFRLLSLSLVLQVIPIFCFFFRHNVHKYNDKDLGKKCHGTKIISYQRDTRCR